MNIESFGKMKNTPIAFASDSNFIDQMRTASYSAVYACRGGGKGLDIHILDCGIDDACWQSFRQDIQSFAATHGVAVSIVRHAIDMELFADCPTWTNGSRAVWARLLLPEILANEEYCVYSDCDMLFLANPAEIVDALERSRAVLVGHRNPYGGKGPDGQWFAKNHLPYDESRYLCSGLLGMNLKELRSLKLFESSVKFISEHRDLVSVDQTVLNWICQGRTEVLDEGWGIFLHECMAFAGELKALHVSGGYPWSRVKNAYDWVARHCSRRETELVNDFRRKIMKAPPFSAPRASARDVVSGWLILQVGRFLNCFGVSVPGHPCFSEMVAAFDGKGAALDRAAAELLKAD